VFDHAKALNARVILQGDRKQHGSVDRGNVFPILERFAGLPVSRMAEIWRQKDQGYKQAVATIAQGDILGGYDQLDALGWIHQTPAFDHNRPLADAYLEALKDKASVLVVAPTHKEGDEITEAIRQRLKEKGVVGQDERTFATLKPLGWTQAERGDRARYDGSEVVQFGRNSGPYKAGQRVKAAEFQPGKVKPEHFNVFAPNQTRLAKGDTVRITANGKDKSGKHKLNNGAIYQVAGFSQGGDIRLANGWVLDKAFGHLAHGLVVTSHASQGTTVDRVLIAMGGESKPAITAEQFYVSVSRGKRKADIFTDLSPTVLRDAIRHGDRRMSASELMEERKPETQGAPTRPKRERKPAARTKNFVQEVTDTYRQLRMKAKSAIADSIRRREPSYER
jgi:ATP-dependent exoDNAse (exonuclease V) alpha subunit